VPPVVNRADDNNEPTTGSADHEPPLDLAGAIATIRRNALPLAIGVALVTGAVLLVSLLAPSVYRATARIVDDPAWVEALDPTASDRRLSTSRELATATPVLQRAAGRIDGETSASLQGKVAAAVDPGAGILDVTATADNPRHAATIANAVAATFLQERASHQRADAERAQAQLEVEIARLRRSGAPRTTVAALRDRVSELTVAEVMAGSGLTLAEPATPPAAPSAPHPLRNALLAFFAALLAGMLLVLARDRLRPRTASARELARAMDAPLLAALPAPSRVERRRARRRGGEQIVVEEAALQASVRLAMPPKGQRIVLVADVGAAGPAATVAGGLARSLSWAGHSTALVLATGAESAGLSMSTVPVIRCTDLEADFEELRRSAYRYLIVVAPPLSSTSALQLLARHTRSVILVAPLGRTTVGDATSAARVTAAGGLSPLGLVVTCSRSEAEAIGREGFDTPVSQPRPPRRPPLGESREPVALHGESNGDGDGNGAQDAQQAANGAEATQQIAT
jgi:capsular polysaccharide biosynthesis protein